MGASGRHAPPEDAMPDATTFALFLAAALVLAVTPGPGIFYVAARSLAGGRRDGILSSLGTAIGGLAHVAAGAAGLSALLLASAEAFTVVKLIGAAYLIYLGVKTCREAAAPIDAPAAGGAFRQGIVVEMLNPKTAAFFLAFIPQFVDPAGVVAVQFVALGAICVALNTGVDILVALAAGRLRQGAERHARLVRRLRLASGLALCGLGAGLALARRG
ncbi:MAG: hypothetical protein OHK0024_24790 [Thalassobaculales bacterium]